MLVCWGCCDFSSRLSQICIQLQYPCRPIFKSKEARGRQKKVEEIEKAEKQKSQLRRSKENSACVFLSVSFTVVYLRLVPCHDFLHGDHASSGKRAFSCFVKDVLRVRHWGGKRGVAPLKPRDFTIQATRVASTHPVAALKLSYLTWRRRKWCGKE